MSIFFFQLIFSGIGFLVIVLKCYTMTFLSFVDSDFVSSISVLMSPISSFLQPLTWILVSCDRTVRQWIDILDLFMILICVQCPRLVSLVLFLWYVCFIYLVILFDIFLWKHLRNNRYWELENIVCRDSNNHTRVFLVNVGCWCWTIFIFGKISKTPLNCC